MLCHIQSVREARGCYQVQQGVVLKRSHEQENTFSVLKHQRASIKYLYYQGSKVIDKQDQHVSISPHDKSPPILVLVCIFPVYKHYNDLQPSVQRLLGLAFSGFRDPLPATTSKPSGKAFVLWMIASERNSKWSALFSPRAMNWSPTCGSGTFGPSVSLLMDRRLPVLLILVDDLIDWYPKQQSRMTFTRVVFFFKIIGKKTRQTQQHNLPMSDNLWFSKRLDNGCPSMITSWGTSIWCVLWLCYVHISCQKWQEMRLYCWFHPPAGVCQR